MNPQNKNVNVETQLSFDKSMLTSSETTREFIKRSSMIGVSPKFLKALELAKKSSPSSTNIFISGESGTGKEVFAKYIHQVSKKSNGPFIAINCSAIPENLLESELFGHAKGSFTGAYDKKIGLFEEAQNGTLFLDEIGDLCLSLQAKLLRVLQERQIKRVGENQYRPINCRIISASHKNLLDEVDEKRFREDLYFRLNVIPITIPPLRERIEDLLPLAEYFLKKFSSENNTGVKSFSSEAIDYLKENPWRGNVRELENAVERAVVLSFDTVIALDSFMPIAADVRRKADTAPLIDDSHVFSIHYADLLPSLEDVIHQYIVYAVNENDGAKDKTAKEIGIDRKTLYRRMEM
ncbi:MAG: sigma-54 interaction domain-containing protein [Bacteriovoracaceae bacterium]